MRDTEHRQAFLLHCDNRVETFRRLGRRHARHTEVDDDYSEREGETHHCL